MNNLATLLARAKQIHGSEGWVSLIRRGFAFMLHQLYENRTYYLSGHTAEDFRNLNEADFVPKIDNFTLKIISTNQEADALEADGLEFRSYVTNASDRLNKGATAFCVFIERELASIGWTAITQYAKDSFEPSSFKVDFLNNQSWSGGAWTNPKYRRMGLSLYCNFKRLEFLFGKGIVIDFGSIAKENIASWRSIPLFNSRIYAEVRYLRILWWKWWKENLLTPVSGKQ